MLIGIAGPPKTGKSTFARSAAQLGKTAVALTDPGELEFYRSQCDDVTVFFDDEWRPFKGQYNPTGFKALMKWLESHEESDTKFIVIDHGPGLGELCMHENLRMAQTDNPKDMPYGTGYTGHDRLMLQLIQQLQLLAKRGKHIVITWHVKMKEMEGVGDAKERKQMTGEVEKEFDEQLLPVLSTSFRQAIPGYFPVWLYTRPIGYGKGRKYLVTAVPDETRPAACRLDFKPDVDPAKIPNSMGEFFKALKEEL